MPEVTLKAIEELLDVKLDEKLDAKLKPIREIQDLHTAALDAIAKEYQKLERRDDPHAQPHGPL
jgi:hypothetical protein